MYIVQRMIGNGRSFILQAHIFKSIFISFLRIHTQTQRQHRMVLLFFFFFFFLGHVGIDVVGITEAIKEASRNYTRYHIKIKFKWLSMKEGREEEEKNTKNKSFCYLNGITYKDMLICSERPQQRTLSIVSNYLNIVCVCVCAFLSPFAVSSSCEQIHTHSFSLYKKLRNFATNLHYANGMQHACISLSTLDFIVMLLHLYRIPFHVSFILLDVVVAVKLNIIIDINFDSDQLARTFVKN